MAPTGNTHNIHMALSSAQQQLQKQQHPELRKNPNSNKTPQKHRQQDTLHRKYVQVGKSIN